MEGCLALVLECYNGRGLDLHGLEILCNWVVVSKLPFLDILWRGLPFAHKGLDCLRWHAINMLFESSPLRKHN